jgi:hypothetical protein
MIAVTRLQEFMLNTDMLRDLPKAKRAKTITQVNTPVHKKTIGIFTPRSYDTLFWCFYIILEGKDAYFMTGNHKFQIEKNKKISFIEKLRKNKDLMKANKLKINDLENDLLNNRCITHKSFLALCILYNVNIIMIFDNYYYEHISVPAQTPYIIRKVNNKYGLDFQSINIANELTNYWKFENIHKPLKGISTFKISELYKIYKCLYPEVSTLAKKHTKQILYNLITLKIE